MTNLFFFLNKIKKLFFYLFIGYPIFISSFLFIRDKNLWVIGGQHGFRDNSKHFYLQFNEGNVGKNDIKLIWISSDKNETNLLRGYGYLALYKWSIEGIITCIKAKVYIFDSYVSNVNLWTSGNTIKVNLWHGVGIKNIERKAKRGITKNIFNKNKFLSFFLHPANNIRPDVFLSTSTFMTKHFSECFDISEDAFFYNIYPRCKLFFYTDEVLSDYIMKHESEYYINILKRIKKQKTYIYMPTWRDSGRDFISDASIDLDELNQAMKKVNGLFIFKLHPNTILNVTVENPYSNIIFMSSYVDVYPLLKFTYCLITDYSSIYYDYILLKDKKIILFPFDYEEYILYERDLAYDYKKFTPGIKVYSFDDLIMAIINDDFSHDNITMIRDLFWKEGINSNDEIFECIEKRI